MAFLMFGEAVGHFCVWRVVLDGREATDVLEALGMVGMAHLAVCGVAYLALGGSVGRFGGLGEGWIPLDGWRGCSASGAFAFGLNLA